MATPPPYDPPPYDPAWNDCPEDGATGCNTPPERSAADEEKRPLPFGEHDPLLHPRPSVSLSEPVEHYRPEVPSTPPSEPYVEQYRPDVPESVPGTSTDSNHEVRLAVEDPTAYPMRTIAWGPWGNIEDAQNEAYLKTDKGACSRCIINAFSYIIIISCSIFLFVELQSGKRDSWKLIIALVFLSLGAAAAIIQGYRSVTYKYLKKIRSDQHASEHFRQVKEAPPHIEWKVQCYHYSDYNKNLPVPGYPEPKPLDYHKRKDKTVTYEASRIFQFRECLDLTGPIDEYHPKFMTRCVTGKAIGFKDRASYEWFIKCRDNFYAEYRPKDHYMDTEEIFILHPMEDLLLVKPNTWSAGLCTGICCYCLYSLCLLSPLYRCCFMCTTQKRCIVYVKVLNV